MAIVVKLDDLLHDRRMTLTELAERIDITLANLSILKTGKARAIRFSTLEAICEVLALPARRLARIPPGLPRKRPEPSRAAACRRIDMASTARISPRRWPDTRRRGVARSDSMSCAPLISCSWSGSARRYVPALFSHEPMARGVIPSLLGAVWLLAFVGLRYPLQMLPLLMFEFAWKTIWLFAFGLPQWSAGTASADLRRRFHRHRAGRDPDAARDPVGLCLSPLRQAAGRTAGGDRRDNQCSLYQAPLYSPRS